MTYTISYGGKTVTAQDTDIPPSLETLIDKLNTLLAGASPQKSSYPTFSLTS
jgi:ABC-type transporter Mla subunit MlaD